MMYMCNGDVVDLVGANAAIVFQGLGWWILNNKANNEHFHDGRYWSYNSNSGLRKTYPFLSKKQMEVCISKLKESGLILIDNFNKDKRDRTLWYSLTDFGEAVFKNSADLNLVKDSININSQNCESHFPNMGNYIPKNGKCNINNNNSNNTTVNYQLNNTVNSSLTPPFGTERIVEAWNGLSTYGISSVTKITPRSDRGKKLKCRVEEYGEEEVIRAIENVKRSKFLCGQNDRMWRITFDWFVLPNNFPKVLDGNYTDPEWKNVISEEEKPKLDPWGRVIEKGWAGRKI